MQLEKIITLASAPVRLRFLAMERSLRAQGCDLPVWVIPYGEDQLFDLPPNCHWWRQPETLAWLDGESAHPTARKYQCFLEANYQFVDADVIFLRDPVAALAPHAGFVMSCGHWRDSDHTITAESLAIFRARSTTWQRWVFNSGQFACDSPLFPDLATLQRVAAAPEHAHTCLRLPYEQPGVNLLAVLSGVPMKHLTLPPTVMESTWAGDYDDADFRRFWRDERTAPYLLHWAGVAMHEPRPIHALFYEYLTREELAEWHAQTAAHAARVRSFAGRVREGKQRAKTALRALRAG